MKKILIVTANYYPEICKELKQSALKNLKNFTLKSIFARYWLGLTFDVVVQYQQIDVACTSW